MAVLVTELSGSSAVVDAKDVNGVWLVVLELSYCLCRMPPGRRSGPRRGPASTVANRRKPEREN